MNNEETSIHSFDFDLICDYFLHIDRQGPGSPEVTLKALSFIEGIHEHSQLADIGCGTGGQTMVLAKQLNCSITGIDLFEKFIEVFNQNAAKLGFEDRVKGIVGSMDALPFSAEAFDLIWSEGAIYNIGFERGLKEWNRFLKPGGYIAVTEASWLSDERPDEIERFWNDAYPEIDTIANKTKQMLQAGYTVVAIFVLPEECWTKHFYQKQALIGEEFLKKHEGNPTARDLVENEQREARLYEKYKTYYGYVFYIGKKIG
jgi:ubiquinone/menaquinone biosynthesis C-methylase UbiE